MIRTIKELLLGTAQGIVIGTAVCLILLIGFYVITGAAQSLLLWDLQR